MRNLGSIRDHQSLSRDSDLSALESLAKPARYRRHQEIYSQNDPVTYRYRLLCGAARRFATQASGRRQIVDFLLPGDYFGFSWHKEHSLTVEAIVDDTLVARYPSQRIDALIESDRGLAQLVRELTADEISRLRAGIFLLGRITAQEKISAFLIEMTERLSGVPDRIVLPMSRYDVADYLAMSVETVSRALTALKRSGAIRLAGTRRIDLVDRAALEDDGDDLGKQISG
jgi:CRP/FNR family transcriptional regulator, nitrogen fixation regulation protein